MSNYWSACYGTGLILNEAEFDAMLKVYMEKNPSQKIDMESTEETPFLRSQYAGQDIWEGTSEEIQDKSSYMSKITDDFAEGITFLPFYKKDGSMNVVVKEEDGCYKSPESYHPMNTNNEICYVFWSDKDMDSPKAFEEKPYASYAEFVQEFKDKLEAYLSADFDWNAHLGSISYACFG